MRHLVPSARQSRRRSPPPLAGPPLATVYFESTRTSFDPSLIAYHGRPTRPRAIQRQSTRIYRRRRTQKTEKAKDQGGQRGWHAGGLASRAAGRGRGGGGWAGKDVEQEAETHGLLHCKSSLFILQLIERSTDVRTKSSRRPTGYRRSTCSRLSHRPRRRQPLWPVRAVWDRTQWPPRARWRGMTGSRIGRCARASRSSTGGQAVRKAKRVIVTTRRM